MVRRVLNVTPVTRHREARVRQKNPFDDDAERGTSDEEKSDKNLG
jgi:hypothetical protein